ncbi:MAG TPA: thioesterase family protein [Anaerolineales bacterium]|nr:thioesterase family protein [Anaerolineales bacterium]
MPDFRFFHPIEVRYGDLDPQGHVNNACYLTYMEQARIAYIQSLGLWPGGTFLDIGIILAEAQVVFNSPILYGQKVRVGVRVSRLGNKSLTMDYLLEDAENGKRLASGSSVLVTYNYRDARSLPIPEDWRKVIAAFEKM